MAHALNAHAEEAYAALGSGRRQNVCEKLFKALTDKGTDVRGVRRPTRLGMLCGLAEATESEIVSVIDVFREPSRSFLMPPRQAVRASAPVSHQRRHFRSHGWPCSASMNFRCASCPELGSGSQIKRRKARVRRATTASSFCSTVTDFWLGRSQTPSPEQNGW
jgi:hypothetical protein